MNVTKKKGDVGSFRYWLVQKKEVRISSHNKKGRGGGGGGKKKEKEGILT